MSTTPFRSPRQIRNYIGKAIRIVGQIFAKEDLYVDGDLEGTIESQDTRVTIGANGRVQANVKAREVVILGQIQGDVEATDKVDLKKDAKLIGNIATSASALRTALSSKAASTSARPNRSPRLRLRARLRLLLRRQLLPLSRHPLPRWPLRLATPQSGGSLPGLSRPQC